jgi:hypothetical protein
VSGAWPSDDKTCISAIHGVYGGMGERAFGKGLGVLSGEAAPGSVEERKEVRDYIDQFADGCLQRSRSGKGRDGPSMAKGGALGLVNGPLMAMMEGVDKLERGHGAFPSKSDYGDFDVPTPSGKSNLEQSQLDTISTLAFAGHDTTANTMTWFCYKMARNPEVQGKLQAELDAVIEGLPAGRQLEYTDLEKLPYLTRCATGRPSTPAPSAK